MPMIAWLLLSLGSQALFNASELNRQAALARWQKHRDQQSATQSC
jgi:hypothetical protein